MPLKMPSLETKCVACLGKFATWRSLAKHAEKTGDIYQETDVHFFKKGRIALSQQATYKEFLSSMAELTNSYLKLSKASGWR